MSDVFFDNIFTDMAFHEKIKQSSDEVTRCAQALDIQAAEARERHTRLSRELVDKESVLAIARTALQKAREEVFERTLRGDAPVDDDLPPPYSE